MKKLSLFLIILFVLSFLKCKDEKSSYTIEQSLLKSFFSSINGSGDDSGGSSSSSSSSSSSGSSTSSSSSSSSGGIIPLKSVYINDNTGNEVGQALDISSYSIIMYSSNNYIYTLQWDGSLARNAIYYSGTDCAGSAYYSAGLIYGKTVFYDGTTHYIPKTIRSDGTAYYDTINKIPYSSHNILGTCTNTGSESILIELESTTRTSVGIQSTITPPLTVVSK